MQQTASLAPTASHVLIIDDDPAALELLARTLAREGYQVEVAENGGAGLRAVRERPPAAITLDVDMPGMDGWAFLSSVKADPKLALIPVIMITTVDEKSRGFSEGAADYLLKPVDRARLLTVLRKLTPAPQGRAPIPDAPEAVGPSPGRVLVVEDDVSNRSILVRMLRKEGWDVAEADTGRTALAAVAETAPDLILLDMGLPDLDGFGVLRELRADPRFARIPVVVVSAKDLTWDERTGLRSTVLKIFLKGAYSRSELLSDIRDCLSNRAPNSTDPAGAHRPA
ncbi:response regulator [Fimbriiglobus ruber]|uniref:Sensory box histidine kinase/response regulator n=1 Tax=Fimbriiglobus ruber TaxID=1908690 RepID=A0A225EA77_9BACT|nr:response regulator [Fimbriiglobus ruber]OWK45317.1 Sensory box histidine kinase/response regulator [Fimbriiglobus ruber]